MELATASMKVATRAVLPPLPPGGLTVLTKPIFTGFFDRAKVNKGLTRVNRVNIFAGFTPRTLRAAKL
jgi:hypothetical protein